MKKFSFYLCFIITSLFLCFAIACKQPTDTTNIQFENEPEYKIEACVRPSNEAIYVRWIGGNANPFEIKVNPVSDPSNKKVYNIPSDSLFFKVPNLENGTEYEILVSAKNNNNKLITKSFKCTPKEKLYKFEITPNSLASSVKIRIIPDEDFRIENAVIEKDNQREWGFFKELQNGILEGEIKDNNLYSLDFDVIDCNLYENKITYNEKFSIDNIEAIKPSYIRFSSGHGDYSCAYDVTNKKIILKWANPMDLDYSHTIVTYNDKKYRVNNEYNMFEIPNIEPTGKEYKGTLHAYDYAGNCSDPIYWNVVANNAPSILDIDISKDFFSATDENRNIDVTIHGVSFNKLSKMADPSVKIGFFQYDYDLRDYVLIGNLIQTKVDIENNTATATMSLPTNKGSRYYVKVKVGGNLSNVLGEINISTEGNYIDSIYVVPSNSYKKYYNDYSQLNIYFRHLNNFSGINFNHLCPFTIQLYDLSNKAYGNPIQINKFNYLNDNSANGTILLRLPKDPGTYYLTLSSHKTEQEILKSNYFSIYDKPTFNSFNIPKYNIKDEEKTIFTIIKGEGFKNPIIDNDAFKVSCDDKKILETANIQIIDNQTLKLYLRVPGYEVDTNITITCGDESISSNFTVTK